MFISESNLAAVTGTSLATTHGWATKGIYPSKTNEQGIRGFEMEDLMDIPVIASMVNNSWDEEMKVTPLRQFNSVELFAGGGGLALGLEKAGFKHILLNEFDTSACNTLRTNRPQWNIIEGDVRHIDFTPLRDKVDFVSGGFPCQAFSFAGKQGGFNDIRGTLFFELARAVKEIRPKVFLGENVKGLVSHDNGKTFKTICNIISELGYTLVPPKVLNGILYQVPQKRERIILIAIRNDIAEHVTFNWPSPYRRVMTLRDALYESEIYNSDVPPSIGAKYPENKKRILNLVPQGGDWRDLPEEIAKEYLGGSWYLGGGKTGMARRLALDEPSLTLTCSPAQKQTERCHPTATRPLSIREYARIQTFPDSWIFQGTMNAQYKQIGNAVPVNLAWAIGRSIIRLLNDLEAFQPSVNVETEDAVKRILTAQKSIVAKKNNKTQTSSVLKGYRQLNLFDLFQDTPNGIICENLISEDDKSYYEQKKSAHALISLIKKDREEAFENQKALEYFTGARFPATIDLKNLTFFIPYIKGKGIRDLYAIKKTYVKEYRKNDSDKTEYRLCFDIQFVKQLFDNYKMCKLEIWRTFTDTNINTIKNLQSS